MNMEWNTGTPPREGDYLSYGHLCPVMVRFHRGGDCWKTSYNSHENWYGITHWMPLPDKPVEKPTAEETLKKAKELAAKADGFEDEAKILALTLPSGSTMQEIMTRTTPTTSCPCCTARPIRLARNSSCTLW